MSTPSKLKPDFPTNSNGLIKPRQKIIHKKETHWKIPHPQVVKVMNELDPPSPCKLVSDKEQPISGRIIRFINVSKPSKNESPKLQSLRGQIQIKKPVSFTLENNSILKRRNNRNVG